MLKAESGRVAVSDDEDEGGTRGREGDEMEEQQPSFVVDTVGTTIHKPLKRSGMESLVQQDDFIQFSTFGGSSDEGVSSSEDDDDDASSVDSDGGNEEEDEEGEDRVRDLVDALMSEQPSREEVVDDERRGGEDEEE